MSVRRWLASLLLCTGCAHVRMELEPLLPACRTTAPADATAVRWVTPFDADDRKSLRAWCDPVGPVALVNLANLANPTNPANAANPANPANPVVIVSWNMAVGEGKLVDLVNDVRRAERDRGEPHLIVLIQEAYRANDVPAECPPRSGVAGRLGDHRDPSTVDVVELARRLRLHAVYVPSMRNGTDCAEAPREDRGNAILSTLPLSGVTAVELPFAQQRRVAVAATVRDGSRVFNVISVHFDTLRGHRRQAEALAKTTEALGWRDRIIVGGDFNARVLDPGVKEMKKYFAEQHCGTGGTHTTGQRLDRLFTRGLSDTLSCHTGTERFGSDHRPLIATF